MSEHAELLNLLRSVKTRDEARLAKAKHAVREIEARIATLRQTLRDAALSDHPPLQVAPYCALLDQSIRRENLMLAQAMVAIGEAEMALRRSLGRFTALTEVLQTEP